MTPTNKLRFVERVTPYPEVKTVRVLQQWYAFDPSDYNAILAGEDGEWRDVPLEVESE